METKCDIFVHLFFFVLLACFVLQHVFRFATFTLTLRSSFRYLSAKIDIHRPPFESPCLVALKGRAAGFIACFTCWCRCFTNFSQCSLFPASVFQVLHERKNTNSKMPPLVRSPSSPASRAECARARAKAFLRSLEPYKLESRQASTDADYDADAPPKTVHADAGMSPKTAHADAVAPTRTFHAGGAPTTFHADAVAQLKTFRADALAQIKTLHHAVADALPNASHADLDALPRTFHADASGQPDTCHVKSINARQRHAEHRRVAHQAVARDLVHSEISPRVVNNEGSELERLSRAALFVKLPSCSINVTPVASVCSTPFSGISSTSSTPCVLPHARMVAAPCAPAAPGFSLSNAFITKKCAQPLGAQPQSNIFQKTQHAKPNITVNLTPEQVSRMATAPPPPATDLVNQNFTSSPIVKDTAPAHLTTSQESNVVRPSHPSFQTMPTFPNSGVLLCHISAHKPLFHGYNLPIPLVTNKVNGGAVPFPVILRSTSVSPAPSLVSSVGSNDSASASCASPPLECSNGTSLSASKGARQVRGHTSVIQVNSHAASRSPSFREEIPVAQVKSRSVSRSPSSREEMAVVRVNSRATLRSPSMPGVQVNFCAASGSPMSSRCDTSRACDLRVNGKSSPRSSEHRSPRHNGHGATTGISPVSSMKVDPFMAPNSFLMPSMLVTAATPNVATTPGCARPAHNTSTTAADKPIQASSTHATTTGKPKGASSITMPNMPSAPSANVSVTPRTEVSISHDGVASGSGVVSPKSQAVGKTCVVDPTSQSADVPDGISPKSQSVGTACVASPTSLTMKMSPPSLASGSTYATGPTSLATGSTCATGPTARVPGGPRRRSSSRRAAASATSPIAGTSFFDV